MKDASDDFRIKLWNKAAEEIFEIPRSVVLGKTTHDIWPKEHADLYHAADLKVCADGVVLNVPEEWASTKSRGDILLYTRKVPLRIVQEQEVSYLLGICDDITAQKNAQTKSREQTAFFNMVAGKVPGMLAYWTADLKCAFANQAYFEWFGKTSEELQGIRMQDLMGPDLFQKNEPYIRGALRGDGQEFERTLTKPNGEIGYTWAHYIPHHEDGKVLGFFVLVSDITPLKREQQQLAKNLAKWESLFSILPVGVSILDKQGQIQESNLALKSMFRLHTENLALGSLRERKFLRQDGTPYPKEEFPSAVAIRTQAISGPVEISVTLEDGSKVWTEVTAAPLAWDDAACVVVSQNITARKQMEMEVRQSEEKYRGIFEDAPLGVAVIDSNSGRIYEINQAYAKMVGRTKDEMLKIDWMSITHPDDVQADLDHMAIMNAGGTNGFQMEKRYIHADQSVVCVLMTISRLKVEDPAYPRHLCMVKNITERINIQKQLEQQRSVLILSNKLTSLGELCAGVAHEINNPLAIIAGNIPLLNKFKNDEAKFPSKTEAIAKATSRIEKIVKGLKKFSRISDVPEYEIKSLNEIIHDSMLMLESKSKEQNTVVTAKVAESLEVSCDEVEIQQVLINLIGNSIDAVKTQEDKWVNIGMFQGFCRFPVELHAF